MYFSYSSQLSEKALLFRPSTLLVMLALILPGLFSPQARAASVSNGAERCAALSSLILPDVTLTATGLVRRPDHSALPGPEGNPDPPSPATEEPASETDEETAPGPDTAGAGTKPGLPEQTEDGNAATDGTDPDIAESEEDASGEERPSDPRDEAGFFQEYCQVQGYIRPAIHFEMRLPVSFWNERLLMRGCEGFCGRLDPEHPLTDGENAARPALERGYAIIATDGGHWGESSRDGLWAWQNRQAEIDWAWRSVKAGADAGRALVDAFYGEDLRFSYFSGCGNGGRMGLIAAQRFPDLFDGIIARAPVTDPSALYASQYGWIKRHLNPESDAPVISREELSAWNRKVMAQCDALDGNRDGIIADYRQCQPAILEARCTDSNRGGLCLRENQKQALLALYGVPSDPFSASLSPGGFPPGSEASWGKWFPSAAGSESAVLDMHREFLRYMAYEQDMGQSYPADDFDFERDPPQLQAMAALYRAEAGELTAFHARGGKLLMLHGSINGTVPASWSVNWLQQVQTAMGDDQDSLPDFLRLFILPGLEHCGGNPSGGPDRFDPLRIIEEWTERDKAPARIDLTSHIRREAIPGGLPTLPARRPETIPPVGEALPAGAGSEDAAPSLRVCPFPARAVYRDGAPDQARSYDCARSDDPGFGDPGQ